MFTVAKKMMVVAMAAFVAVVVPIAGVQAQDKDAAALAQQQQEQAQIQAIAEVQANRDAFIAGLVEQWKPVVVAMGMNGATWEQRFIGFLVNESPETLLAIQAAADYDQVRAALQGRAVAISGDGLSIETLGSTSQDLVFTPLNPPCRAVDTRYDTDGLTPVPGGSTRSYLLYGNPASQGGTVGCPNPGGRSMTAASLNLAAVGPSSASHLRIWPYLAAMPTVSYLNYAAGQNIANAGIIGTCYACAAEVSVYNGSTTNYIIDVMGYFYPVSQSDPSLNEVKSAGYNATSAGAIVSDFAFHMFGPKVYYNVAAGDKIHVTTSVALGTTCAGGSGAMDIYPCMQNYTTGVITTLDGGIWDIRVPNGTRIPISINGVFAPAADDYYFGACYRTTSTCFNNNEWGYTSIIGINF